MNTRFILVLSTLFLNIVPAVASNSGSRMLLALGENFNGIRAVPHMGVRPPVLTPFAITTLQNKGLIRPVARHENYDTRKMLDTSDNLMMVRLVGSPFRPENSLLLSALSGCLRKDANLYTSNTIIKAHGLVQKEKKQRRKNKRSLSNFVEGLRYDNPNKAVILMDMIQDLSSSMRFEKLLEELKMPGFCIFAEVEPAREASPLIAAFRKGQPILGGTYIQGTPLRPGSAAFISLYTALLFTNIELPSTLPTMGHVLSKPGDRDLFGNVMTPGTYIKSVYQTDRFFGVVYPEVDRMFNPPFNFWTYKTKWPNGTVSSFSYPRFEEGSFDKKI